MITHVDAKRAVDAIPGITPLESLFTRAVGWHETNYGQGWKRAGQGSFNMGAITTSKPDQYSFQHEDVRNDNGTLVKYTTWFKGFPTARDGFNALAKQVLSKRVRLGLRLGGIKGGVKAMYLDHYFLGTHRRDTPEGNAANVNDYYKKVSQAIESIRKKTGERIPGSGRWWKIALVVGGIVIGGYFARRALTS